MKTNRKILAEQIYEDYNADRFEKLAYDIKSMTKQSMRSAIIMLQSMGLNPVRKVWIQIFNIELNKR